MATNEEGKNQIALLRIFSALAEISLKFPIGVPTIYKTLFSGSSPLWDNERLIFIFW